VEYLEEEEDDGSVAVSVCTFVLVKQVKWSTWRRRTTTEA
jgi:hypothetical protein